MKEKDITQKVLEDNNDIFADIVNVLLFDGESEVEENELVNTTVHSQYKAEDGKVHEQERDIAKYWKRGGTDIVLYGIENQTKVEKRMPARISGYEGASYRGQYDKTTIKHVDEILKFLSVMTGDNRYEEILSDKEGVSNMCDVAQRLEDRGIEKGLQKGREEGLSLGGNQMIYSLVEDKSISMEKGAQKLGISVEKLRANMINAGYKCPDME